MNNGTVIEQFLEKYDFWFSQHKKSYYKYSADRARRFRRFLSMFTIEKIQMMELKDYAVGTKTNDSFCWWVETELHDLGEIRGGQLTAYQKFGIYYNKEKKKYSFGNSKTKKTKFGKDDEEIFTNIKQSILSLIEDLKSEDLNGIKKNGLNPLFKNKLTFLYDSNNWLPIYSDSDLNTLLTIFDIPFDIKIDRVHKRKLLFNFYKSLKRDDITSLSFMDFVYDDLGYRSFLRSDEAKELQKSIIENEYTLEIVNDVEELFSKNDVKHGLVPPMIENDLENKIVGKAGEEIVKKFLNTHKEELGIVGDIDCPCEYDDSKHYDFSYKNKNDEIVYVESKATKINRKLNIVFKMSNLEYDFMNINKSNYFVFYVNDVFNGKVIKSISADKIFGEPIKYLISFRAK